MKFRVIIDRQELVFLIKCQTDIDVDEQRLIGCIEHLKILFENLQFETFQTDPD